MESEAYIRISSLHCMSLRKTLVTMHLVAVQSKLKQFRDGKSVGQISTFAELVGHLENPRAFP